MQRKTAGMTVDVKRPGGLLRLFAWCLLPELLLILGGALLASVTSKRAVLIAAAACLLLLLLVSPVLPRWALPLRGKWLRRAIVGAVVMGLAYAGPVSAVRKVWSYNWTVAQLQQRAVLYGSYRPDTRLPVWLGEVPLPRWLGGLPMRLVLGAAGCLMAVQFALIWRDLEDKPRRQEP